MRTCSWTGGKGARWWQKPDGICLRGHEFGFPVCWKKPLPDGTVCCGDAVRQAVLRCKGRGCGFTATCLVYKQTAGGPSRQLAPPRAHDGQCWRMSCRRRTAHLRIRWTLFAPLRCRLPVVRRKVSTSLILPCYWCTWVWDQD